MPTPSWFEMQKKKQGVTGDSVEFANERDPYGIYSRIGANLGEDAPADLRSDLAGMRSTGEAADAKRAPLQAIYEGKAYSMPSKRSTVQQPEAVAALDLVMKNRAIAEQKAKDDALMREAQADRAAERNRKAATFGQEQEARRMALDKQKRMSAAAQKMAGPRTGVMGITDRLGITQQDPRITAAAATEDPAQIAAAQQAIRAEEEAKKNAAANAYGVLANNALLPAAERAKFAQLEAESRGIKLDPLAFSGIEKATKVGMPVEDVARVNPKIEQVIQNQVRALANASPYGDLFGNGGEFAGDAQRGIQKVAGEIAAESGGNPSDIMQYILQQIAQRKEDIQPGGMIRRGTSSLLGLVGNPRAEYSQQLLAGMKQPAIEQK